MILLLIILAKTCGENHPSGIADWAKHRTVLLVDALKLERKKMPHHSTYWRVLAEVVNVEELEQMSGDYLNGKKFFYDLIWYLSAPGWPSPHLVLLNNALAQTGWGGGTIRPETWRKTLLAHLENISWKQALADVEPFLLSSDESSLPTRENLNTRLQTDDLYLFSRIRGKILDFIISIAGAEKSAPAFGEKQGYSPAAMLQASCSC